MKCLPRNRDIYFNYNKQMDIQDRKKYKNFCDDKVFIFKRADKIL